jgi:hypothetical protein
MKLLTATSRTQGQRDSDFTWCIDGELVTPPTDICGRDLDNPDGGCGCGRAFIGLNSHKATTTATVRDIDGYTFDDLLTAVCHYRSDSDLDDDEYRRLVKAETAEIAELAAGYDDGTVLEIRLGEVRER